MKYFFVLGKNQALSLAELSSVLGAENLNYTGNGIALFDSERAIDYDQLLQRLGGVIKIGQVDKKFSIGLTDKIKKFVCDLAFKKRKLVIGKFKFGISQYGSTNVNTKKLGMEIKNHLKNNSFNSRLVTSKEKTLSSVVVETNKLTKKGIEIVLFTAEKRVMIGHTLRVQPFKELSRRDYGRPQRDDQSGMLPPKLAQIMINLAGGYKNNFLLDPFCGSGTILTEALLLRYKKLIGTDISSQAISDTQKNIDWIMDRYKISSCSTKLFCQNCAKISTSLSPNSVKSIVTEPYLGPQRGYYNFEKTTAKLETLYSQCLKEFNKILEKQGRIVIIFPVFTTGKNKIVKLINPDLNGFHIISPLPSAFNKYDLIDLTKRNTIIYGRQKQRIWRELVILEHKK